MWFIHRRFAYLNRRILFCVLVFINMFLDACNEVSRWFRICAMLLLIITNVGALLLPLLEDPCAIDDNIIDRRFGPTITAVQVR